MDPIRTLHPLARACLLDGPLSADLDAYLPLLERGRYAEASVDKHLRALAHFSHWMTRCRLAAEQLDEDFVDQFLNHNLPRCDRHATALRTRGVLSAGLGHLLTVLRLQRVIAGPPSPTGPVLLCSTGRWPLSLSPARVHSRHSGHAWQHQVS